MPTAKPRSASIKITLTPELHDRLRQVAAQLGQAPATCASMAVSVWVAQQSRALAASDRVADQLAREVGPAIVDHVKTLTSGDA